MTKDLILSDGKFTKLVLDIRKILDHGRARAQAAANRELLQTYWNVGARIAEERITENAGYGESIMGRLADELHADRTTLVRCVLYQQYYPKGVPDETALSWSHYRELLTVKDDKARSFYEKEAKEKDWTRDQLVKAIQADHYVVDPTDDGKKSTKKLKRPDGAPFIYRAEIVRVVDGDTLIARLDLGFEVWKEQRIRLAEVDTPPIKEDGGQEAFAYVQEQMAKAKVIVIRTRKEDIHGRYLGHIFYSLDAKEDWEKVFLEGRYLNQELLDRGLARIY